jgi:hypothetical protein
MRGINSAVMSLNAPTWIVPSSTTLPSESSEETTRTANGMGPAGTVGRRGGDTMMLTVPEASGNSDRESGANVTVDAASPKASNVKRSTTVPLLRIVKVIVVLRPGSTLIVDSDS